MSTYSPSSKRNKKNPFKRGEATLPLWWMQETPHYILDLDDDQAKRDAEMRMALFYAEMAEEDAERGIMLDIDGNPIENEPNGGENSSNGGDGGGGGWKSNWGGRQKNNIKDGEDGQGAGGKPKMFGGRNFKPGSPGWDPRQWGIDPNDPDFEEYQSGAMLPPEFITAMNNYARATGHYQSVDSGYHISNMKASGMYGSSAEKPAHEPAFIKVKLRGTNRGSAVRSGKYNDSPNKHLHPHEQDEPEEELQSSTYTSVPKRLIVPEEHVRREEPPPPPVPQRKWQSRPSVDGDHPLTAPTPESETTAHHGSSVAISRASNQEHDQANAPASTTAETEVEPPPAHRHSSPHELEQPRMNGTSKKHELTKGEKCTTNIDEGDFKQDKDQKDEEKKTGVETDQLAVDDITNRKDGLAVRANQKNGGSRPGKEHHVEPDPCDQEQPAAASAANDVNGKGFGQKDGQQHRQIVPPLHNHVASSPTRALPDPVQDSGNTLVGTSEVGASGSSTVEHAPTEEDEVLREQREKLALYYADLAEQDEAKGVLCDLAGNLILAAKIEEESASQISAYELNEVEAPSRGRWRSRSRSRKEDDSNKKSRWRSASRDRHNNRRSTSLGIFGLLGGRMCTRGPEPKERRMFSGVNYQPGSLGWDPRPWGIIKSDPDFKKYQTAERLPPHYVDAMHNYAKNTGQTVDYDTAMAALQRKGKDDDGLYATIDPHVPHAQFADYQTGGMTRSANLGPPNAKQRDLEDYEDRGDRHANTMNPMAGMSSEEYIMGQSKDLISEPALDNWKDHESKQPTPSNDQTTGEKKEGDKDEPSLEVLQAKLAAKMAKLKKLQLVGREIALEDYEEDHTDLGDDLDELEPIDVAVQGDTQENKAPTVEEKTPNVQEEPTESPAKPLPSGPREWPPHKEEDAESPVVTTQETSAKVPSPKPAVEKPFPGRVQQDPPAQEEELRAKPEPQQASLARARQWPPSKPSDLVGNTEIPAVNGKLEEYKKQTELNKERVRSIRKTEPYDSNPASPPAGTTKNIEELKKETEMKKDRARSLRGESSATPSKESSGPVSSETGPGEELEPFEQAMAQMEAINKGKPMSSDYSRSASWRSTATNNTTFIESKPVNGDTKTAIRKPIATNTAAVRARAWPPPKKSGEEGDEDDSILVFNAPGSAKPQPAPKILGNHSSDRSYDDSASIPTALHPPKRPFVKNKISDDGSVPLVPQEQAEPNPQAQRRSSFVAVHDDDEEEDDDPIMIFSAPGAQGWSSSHQRSDEEESAKKQKAGEELLEEVIEEAGAEEDPEFYEDENANRDGEQACRQRQAGVAG